MENEGNNTNAQEGATNNKGAVTQPANTNTNANSNKTEGAVTRNC